ncbi:TPA: hypothetical protein HA241_02445 [Candidatus Woesearchaeota archaeon]|nr:hypothetical protein [Candidatus Woesearchaeota archaeon]
MKRIYITDTFAIVCSTRLQPEFLQQRLDRVHVEKREKEGIAMETLQAAHRCIECDEVITNPICGECLAGEMKVMIGEQNRKLGRLVHGFEVDGATVCLLCHKNMGLCAHCMSKDMYEYLIEEDEELADEFMARFDFDLRRVFVK